MYRAQLIPGPQFLTGQAAAIHHHERLSPSVEYSIVLSPVYRVPVLYFFLHHLPDHPDHPLPDLEKAHGLLVPDHLRATIRDMSIMGGISLSVRHAKDVAISQADGVRQNHPVTDFPAYFIHPCNTAEAMREIIGDRRISPSEYLQIWIGLVGSCVSLSLPSQLALTIKQEID
jgi:ubiquitin-like-conjugating enzyme ATG10